MEIQVRQAREDDIEAIRHIFVDAYGPTYPYRDFYDQNWLRRAVYGDDLVMVVAQEGDGGPLVGTGSVIFSIGVHSDLVGEFGRLAVLKEARGKGVAKKIMARRIELVEHRLHMALVDNRTDHPYSQMISEEYGFVPVGFMPLKHKFENQSRESVATFARLFGPARSLRRNHPRLIPEAAPVARLAMENLSLESDIVIDEGTGPYVRDHDFEIDSLEATGMPHLLRIARGRVKKRLVFGPMQLSYGFFKLATNDASYLVARRSAKRPDAVAGAIGFIHDKPEHNIRVFELIAATDEAIHFLFTELVARAKALDVEYIEIEVSAYEPRLQRTLLELDFLPAAYLPAMVFHDVERLDVIKMVHLLTDFTADAIAVVDSARPFATMVSDELDLRTVLPHIARRMDEMDIFTGLDDEQARRLAAAMTARSFEQGRPLFQEGDDAREFFVLLQGEVEVRFSTAETVAHLGPGDVVGENAMLAERPHNATVTAKKDTVAAVLERDALQTVVRRQPDIAVVLYRNLAVSLGHKLINADRQLSESARQSSGPAATNE
jgi:CRP-like cAMP-binding protein/GNAT superfamily N-acetyltransferase